MRRTRMPELLIVHAEEATDPSPEALADWVATAAWSLGGFALAESVWKPCPVEGPETVGGATHRSSRLDDADAIVVLTSAFAADAGSIVGLATRLGRGLPDTPAVIVCRMARRPPAQAPAGSGVLHRPPGLPPVLQVTTDAAAGEGAWCDPDSLASRVLRAVLRALRRRCGWRVRSPRPVACRAVA